jgi:membrane protease YdiL (CAAX protease family)
MDKLYQLAYNRPIRFGLLVVLMFVVISFITIVIAHAFTGPAMQIVYALGSFSGVLCFSYLLWRLGWLRSAGITRLGSWRAWLLVLPAILLIILWDIYVIFGEFSLTITDPALAGTLGLYHLVDGGLFQELAFRGLILYALVRFYGGTRQGTVKSVLLSAVLFSCVHLFNFLFLLADPSWKSAQVILLQVLETFFSGVFLAVVVLFVESIWPAVLYHGLLNAFVNVKALSVADFEETTSMWLLIILLQLPAILYALFLLQRGSPGKPSPRAMALSESKPN